jgi:hypothetical protein
MPFITYVTSNHASYKEVPHNYVSISRCECLCGLVSEFLAAEQRCILLPVRYEQNLHMSMQKKVDCPCGLVVSSWLQVQRSGFDSQHYQIF